MKHRSTTFAALALALAALLCLAAGAQAATTYTVNTTNDTHDANPADAICADAANQCSLRAAIEQANADGSDSVVSVPPGVYSICTNGELDVVSDGALTVQGTSGNPSDVKVDGCDDYRIFQAQSGAALTLQSLTAQDGYTDSGDGAGIEVLNAASLTMDNSIVTDNYADDATNGGGGIKIEPGAAATITNSAITNNYAYYDGGGIYAGGDNLRIIGSAVDRNTSGGQYGGGIYQDSGDLAMALTSVSHNTSYTDGGGIYADGNNLAIQQSTIESNTGTYGSGGGIYQTAGALTVNSTSLSKNTSYYYGGGLYAAGSSASLGSDTIDQNLATYDGGGGIYAATDVTVDGGSVDGNRSPDDYGGGIEQESGDLSISNASISRNETNSGGGGIYADGNSPSISNTRIDGNNAASGYGGGIENYTDAMTISASSLSGNIAYYGGGGLYNDAGTSTTLTNTTVAANRADTYQSSSYDGGGIDHEGGVLNLVNATVGDNSIDIQGDGGGIYNNSSGGVNLVNTLFARNIRGKSAENCGGTGGTFTSGGHNLDDDGTCFLNGSGDLTGVTPQVDKVGDNGGEGTTMALLAGSPAIDAGDDAACPSTDERGVARPQGAHCDIGAFEYVAPAPNRPPATTTTPAPTTTPPANPPAFQFTASSAHRVRVATFLKGIKVKSTCNLRCGRAFTERANYDIGKARFSMQLTIDRVQTQPGAGTKTVIMRPCYDTRQHRTLKGCMAALKREAARGAPFRVQVIALGTTSIFKAPVRKVLNITVR
jgi:CSLREA domain-containing protein